jgi:hypothetical protein
MSQIKTLQSWKEIARYIGRAVRTVQRWELFGLPVRRLPGESSKNPVYAIAHELDAWLLSNPQNGAPIGPGTVNSNGNGACPDGLEAILITDQIYGRPLKSTDGATRLKVLQALGKEVVSPPGKLLGVLVSHARELCCAGSAGLSLLHSDDNEQFFHWDVLAGNLKDCVGQTTPRDFSPCGFTLDRRSSQLFSYPAQYFDYLQSAPADLVEALVIPIFVDRRGIGTIWIISHDENCQFDSGDLTVMTSLAAFCEAALSCHSLQSPSVVAEQSPVASPESGDYRMPISN